MKNIIPRVVTAIVPMRDGSERVKNKNIRNFCEKPLYTHIIRTLIECKRIDRVVIDTNIPDVIKNAPKLFPNIVMLNRPSYLSGGEVSMNDVLANILKQIEGNYFIQTHATNPLLKSSTIDLAIKSFFEYEPVGYDSLFTVNKVQKRFWNGDGQPINHNLKILLRTQDLPPMYEENSNIYLFSRTSFINNNNRIGIKPRIYEVDALEAWDIDTETDFIIGEMLSRIETK